VSARSLAAAVLVTAALAGCGDDEPTTAAPPATVAGATGATGAAGAISACVDGFNDDADDNLARLARLSHEPGDEILVGTFAGPEFSAETYDVDIADGDGRETAVEPGACVVTEVSEDLGTVYVFVIGDDGEWHNLLVTDPDVVLADDPASQLADVRTVQLEDVEAPRVPELIP
jgi:hypothetical protein